MVRRRPIAVALGGGRTRPAPFCATLMRDISTPHTEDWDVENTLEVWANRPFHSVSALAREPDIQQGAWERDDKAPDSGYTEADWEQWDDEGRDARDSLWVKRCSGKWLSFTEAVRLDRALGVYNGLRPQDGEEYNMALMKLSQKRIP